MNAVQCRRLRGDPIALEAQSRGETSVCLVSMPYAALPRPSIALSLLKQILEDARISTLVLYPNLWFAEKVGISRYHLCSHRAPTEFLVGEWTFAEAAFGRAPRDDEGFLNYVKASKFRVPGYKGADAGERLVTDLRFLRAAATRFIDEAARRVLATGARIVGCTSTFEQHVSSLALLRRIRELAPSVITIIGGANCETVMGQTTHRQFSWVDYVVSGEADGLIAELCRLALEHGREVPLGDLPSGVLGPPHRKNSSHAPGLSRALFRDLDALPIPDFGDYFDELKRSRLGAAISPGLPLETSRGCWWGAVSHCTFCGLNGSSMAFRSKSPERVVAEVRELERRHGIPHFETVDNILDMAYFRSVLPRLAEDGRERRLFYEVKANLKRKQVEQLREGGVTWVQPGIESLHTKVLRLMGKGVQGWQNVQLLKWSRQFGLRLSWSVLWGFPGEEDAWYEEMARWIPRLEHLQAPAGLIRLRYDRYSVYHTRARELGLKLWPISAMRFVYPLPVEDLANLAYFFIEEGGPDAFEQVGSYTDILSQRPGLSAVLQGVRTWRREFWRGLSPILSLADGDGVLEILDTRRCAKEFRARVTGLTRAVFLACDEAPLEERLPEILLRDHGLNADPDEVEKATGDLERRGWVLRIDGHIVALAVRGDLPRLPKRRAFPGGFVEDVSLSNGRAGNQTEGSDE